MTLDTPLKETWDLDSIFPGGSQSPELAAFLAELESDLTSAAEQSLPEPLAADTAAAWEARYEQLFDLYQRLFHAASFIGCLLSQDVKDETARQLNGRMEKFRERMESLWTLTHTTAARQPDNAWEALVSRPALEPVAFNMSYNRELAQDLMPQEMETLANALATDGYHAWDWLYRNLNGRVTVDFRGETLSLGQLQSKYTDSPERETRQAAFELFEEEWGELAEACAAALNHQAGFRLTLYKQRGWDDVLYEPLRKNRLSREALEAMWDVIDRKSGRLNTFFAAKARLFGLEGEQLSWYDMPAPIGSVDKSYSYAEAAGFVVDNLRHFDPAIADFCQTAVDAHWIEAENRSGKRAGAYCTRMPLAQQPRIFMTYNGSYNGLLTLAHELGHGYHGWVLNEKPFAAGLYTMSVAETASTFNELVVNKAALAQSDSPAERLSLLGQMLNDATSFLMNIRSRFEFEKAFFARRRSGILSVAELSELMTAAQERVYKGGLADYHPLFWASKLHFYLTRVPFYNFPYTFGYLFSNGVFAYAEGEGASFSQTYRNLLLDTGSMLTDELAKQHLGVDLSAPEFWETAVDRALAPIDEFAALVDELA